MDNIRPKKTHTETDGYKLENQVAKVFFLTAKLTVLKSVGIYSNAS